VGEDGGRLGCEPVVRLEPQQDERVPCGAVQGAETAIVVVLPPERVVAPAGA
jgi:hypothetical protein